MRMGTFMAAAALVAIIGFLGFRILDLEQRVAGVTHQLGSAPSEPEVATSGADAGPHPSSTVVAAGGYEQRLRALEKRVQELQASIKKLDKIGASTDPVQADKEILSVIERESSRLRDVQLEWHRQRWVEARETQLSLFARQFGLSPQQTESLHKVLDHEVDEMVKQLRRPTLLEDPDQGASDWQAMLDETDREAQKILTPAQRAAWDQGRTFERKFLWPWLPNNGKK
jgi:hypothetical protein